MRAVPISGDDGVRAWEYNLQTDCRPMSVSGFIIQLAPSLFIKYTGRDTVNSRSASGPTQ